MILVNGCSRTHGTWYCVENGIDPWPAVLGKRLGEEVINIAESGSSISSVVKTTISWLENNSQKPDMVLCSWPQTARFEIPRHNFDRQKKPIVDSYRKFSPDRSLMYDFEYEDIFDEAMRQQVCVSNYLSLQWIRTHQMHAIHYFILYCKSKDINLKTFFTADRVWESCKVNSPDMRKTVKHNTKIYPIIEEEIKSYDMFNDLQTTLNKYKIAQGHFGHGTQSTQWPFRSKALFNKEMGTFDTHDDKEGHEFMADLIIKRFNNEPIDWHKVDTKRILEQIKLKPTIKNSDMMWGILSEILKSEKVQVDGYEESFIYD